MSQLPNQHHVSHPPRATSPIPLNPQNDDEKLRIRDENARIRVHYNAEPLESYDHRRANTPIPLNPQKQQNNNVSDLNQMMSAMDMNPMRDQREEKEEKHGKGDQKDQIHEKKKEKDKKDKNPLITRSVLSLGKASSQGPPSYWARSSEAKRSELVAYGRDRTRPLEQRKEPAKKPSVPPMRQKPQLTPYEYAYQRQAIELKNLKEKHERQRNGLIMGIQNSGYAKGTPSPQRMDYAPVAKFDLKPQSQWQPSRYSPQHREHSDRNQMQNEVNATSRRPSWFQNPTQYQSPYAYHSQEWRQQQQQSQQQRVLQPPRYSHTYVPPQRRFPSPNEYVPPPLR